MRAILVALDDSHGLAALRSRLGALMLPLVDRPFLQHVVEHLVGRGFTTFDVILGPTAERARDLLGDGSRWGATIRQHTLSDPRRPYEVLGALAPAQEGESALLGHADRLPSGIKETPPSGGPVLYRSRGADRDAWPTWTGWAWIGRGDLDGLPPEANEDDLGDLLLTANTSWIIESASVLDATSHAGLLAAHRDALARRGPEVLIATRQVEPRTWVGRDVVRHPSAQLVPPVFVGSGCRIGEGVRIGPNAVLGAGCLVDRWSTIADSVILPATYVGEGLEVADSIVDRGLLINVRLGTEVVVEDETLLASLAGPIAPRLAGLLSRVAAGAIPASRLKDFVKSMSKSARPRPAARGSSPSREGHRERRRVVR